jgi:hypothetical protein
MIINSFNEFNSSSSFEVFLDAESSGDVNKSWGEFRSVDEVYDHCDDELMDFFDFFRFSTSFK